MRIAIPIPILVLAIVSCSRQETVMPATIPPLKSEAPSTATSEVATFGGGCFWCTEAVFLDIKGVKKVVSGYSGGTLKNPTYEAVCSGSTGHAEVIQITFDPQAVPFEKLLEAHWITHDPTTLNSQGNDYGTQYRSAIFYHNDKQRDIAEKYRKLLEESKAFDAPIVTEIVKFDEFFPAEDYHQNFYARNPNQSYCRAIIPAKLAKLKKVFEK